MIKPMFAFIRLVILLALAASVAAQTATLGPGPYGDYKDASGGGVTYNGRAETSGGGAFADNAGAFPPYSLAKLGGKCFEYMNGQATGAYYVFTAVGDCFLYTRYNVDDTVSRTGSYCAHWPDGLPWN